MTRALITGVTGQDGSYLAELLLAKDYNVFGLVRHSSTNPLSRIEHLKERGLQLICGDVTDNGSLQRAVDLSEPDEVYHLASQSHVRVSFEVPTYTADATGMGTLNLLEVLRRRGPNRTKIYYAGSSEQFGNEPPPQNENTVFAPRSPYACSKVFGFNICRNYREAYGMRVWCGILFNHESPRRGEDFVTRKIAKAAALIATGRQDKLLLGNLEAKRDWGFAGDYVRAMWMMLQQEKSDDYVIATGKAHTVREFCDRAFSSVGLPLIWERDRGLDVNRRVLVEVDPRLKRPAEVDYLCGDAEKALGELGWSPEVNFEQLVEMMVKAELW